MICNNCGSNIADGMLFCTSCGAELNPEKKGKKTAVIIVSVILAVLIIGGVFAAFWFGFFGVESPLQEIVDAYVLNETEGYNLTVTTTKESRDSEGVLTDQSESTVEYVYGRFDTVTAKREFECTVNSYSTRYKSGNFSYSSYNYGESWLYNYDDEQKDAAKADLLNALSAGNYKDLSDIFNRLDYRFPLLDENGFNRAVNRINGDLEEELREIFGFEVSTEGSTTEYVFRYNMGEAYDWAIAKLESHPEAFRDDEKYQFALDSLKYKKQSFSGETETEHIIKVEDGHIVYEKITTENRTDDGMEKTVEEKTYSNFGNAQMPQEVMKEFNERKNQLGDNYRMTWSSDGSVDIYDENGVKVN